MINQCAKNITQFLIKSGIIKNYETEAYIYGLELFLIKLIFNSAIIMLSLITNTFSVSILFLFSFYTIRSFAGGYHCKKTIYCFVLSMLIYSILVFLFKYNNIFSMFTLLLSSNISFGIIVAFSPVASEQNPLTATEIKQNKKISIIICFICLLLSWISFFIDNTIFFYSSSYSLTATAVLIIFSLRRCKNEKAVCENDCKNSWKEHQGC